MKQKPGFSYILIIAAFGIMAAGCGPSVTTTSRDRCFDDGWKFLRDSITGAEAIDFDDTGWQDIDLPHDWSMEDLQGNSNGSQTGPFSKASPGGPSTGHFIGGTAWYRKHFILSGKDENRISILRFDGIYMESDVWVNGHHAGYHPYGYTPFNYDITRYLNPAGEENIIAVRVHNTGANSRWYSGSGIYRHVWLTVLNPIHIDPWGVYITTPEISENAAQVDLQVNVTNNLSAGAEITIITGITDPTGITIASVETAATIGNNSNEVIMQSVEIENPRLWSVTNPQLYTASISIMVDEKPADSYECHFGIRSIRFSTEDGFLLNGEPVLLKGACMHHDNGLLGSAAFDRAEERRVEIMKSNGFNAIRTSHNPPSQAFLDACDRLGMLVIDEAFDMWAIPKNTKDYSRFFNEWHVADLSSMLLRDRNHPSIIIWSIGNEIYERADPSGVKIAEELAGTVRKLDPTRPVTAAICEFWDHPGRSWDQTAPAFESLDIGGYNYQWRNYEPDHGKYPSRIMAGTESFPFEAYENWQQVKKHPWVIGDFVWTGMDYLGESGIGQVRYLDENEPVDFFRPWPWFISWCGDIDICGDKKPQSFYRDVVWENSRLELAVHAPVPVGKKEYVSAWGWPDEYQCWNWTGQEGNPLQVSVYTSCPMVRLELNGKLIGEQALTEATGITARFIVPFEPGELTAIGLSDGRELNRKALRTSGPPTTLRLEAERQEIQSGRNELAYVRIEVTDEAGNLVPDASIRVSLTISGHGEIIAAGNAGPDQMESLKDPSFQTFRGKALVIIRSDGSAGTIGIRAEGEGLEAGSVTIKAL